MTQLTYSDMIGIQDLVGENIFNDLQSVLFQKHPFFSKCFGEIQPDESVYPEKIMCIFHYPLGIDVDCDDPKNLVFFEYDYDEDVDKDYLDILVEHLELTKQGLPSLCHFMSLEPLIFDMLPNELHNDGRVYHKHKDKTGSVNYLHYNTGDVLIYSEHDPKLEDFTKQNTVYLNNSDFTEEEMFKSTVNSQFDEVSLFIIFLNMNLYIDEIKDHISNYVKEELW